MKYRKYKYRQHYFIVALIITFTLSVFEDIPIINYQITGESFKYVTNSINLKMMDYFIIYTLTFLSNFSAFVLCYFMIKPFKRENKRISHKNRLMSLASIFVVFCFYLPLQIYFEDLGSRFYFFNLVRSFFVFFMSISYTVAVRSTFLQQETLLENEQLKKENLQTQFEALKNDLSPHFLFNSLNALQTLIRENPEVANQYVNHLSIVLRSSLQNNDNQYVSLQDELKMVKSFIFLMEMRYGENLIVEIDIPPHFENSRIPPLTIQTLIENAIKHNEISKRNPLKITVKIENNLLIVTNNIQQKLTPEISMGIGLSNLSRRFYLLSGSDIVISKNNNQFQVEIPLLKD
jgi:sensor histidine kinase YesM